MAEIELRNVSKRFDDTVAVRDASFTIRDGEFFILVGPSGCGKSTLLNMIVGLESISDGEIRVDGERVNEVDPRNRNMAMVFQSYAIYPHMSVRENMAFPLKLAKLAKSEIDDRVNNAAEILELTDFLDRKPRELSGGQRQRVAMGRAIVREPAVFLLDEPLSNLDAKLRVQMRMEIARLQRRLGTTTIFVTHDQTEALTLGDRIAVLRKGEVLQIGTPRELYEAPANVFVAGFIGSPAMNFLPARLDNERLMLPVGQLVLSAQQRALVGNAHDSLIVGFRPEHLTAVSDGDETGAARLVQTRVDMVEWLGADVFVHFDVSLESFEEMHLPEDLDIDHGKGKTASLVARVDPGAGLKEGDALNLALQPERVHLFDGSSGENLTLGID